MNPAEKKSQQDTADWNKNKHKNINDSNGISLGSSGAPHHGNPPTGSGPNPRSSQNSTNPSVQHSTKQNTTNQLPKEKEKKKYHLNGDKKSKKLDLEEKNGREKSDNISDKTKDNKPANLANSNNSRRDGHNNNETKEKQTAEVGTLTEPECLAPCDTGTEVHLSGIIWHESDSGMLVVNVTWRNRSYVGTLLDASRHDWAPPRLTDGESDSNQQPRGKTRPGRRGEKGAKGGRTRNEGVNGRTGKVGKRISPNDQENNSDGDGKPANKKPRPNPSTRVPTPDGSESNPKGSKSSSSMIGGRDSPVPIGGYYVCEEADCEKKFKNLEALQYHKPKCKKVPSSKNPDSDVPKKAKLENTKSEVIKNDPDNSNNQSAANNSNTDRVTSSSTTSSSSLAPSSGENETKPKIENNQDDKSNEDTDIFDVAKTMIGLRNENSGHENHENGQPPSLNAPPALAKRPDNPKLTPADKKREMNHHPPSIHQPTMPRLVKKPPIEGAGSLPPMPSLQPKPGLMTHQGPTTAVLTSTATSTQSQSSVPVVQNAQSAPGTPLKPRISPSGTPVVLPIDPTDPKLVSINPIGGETNTPIGGAVSSGGVGVAGGQKRTRSPPFQPVTEASVSPTPNPRASSPYSDISDAGDENPITDKEKDIENKKIGLKSSLTYKANTSLSVNNQYPVHQRYNETNYGLSSRDEKKEAKEDLKEAKIVKNEFKTQSDTSRLPPVSSSHDQNRAKLHSTETKKDRPTATIPPMNSSQSTDRNKNDSKSGPQKQHTPKKDQSPTGKTSLPGVGIPMGLHLPSTFAPAYPQPGYPYGGPPPGFPISQPPGGISGTFYPSNVPYMMNPQGQSKGDYKREKPGSNQERGQSASPQRTATYPYPQPQAPTSFHAGHYPHGASYGHLKK